MAYTYENGTWGNFDDGIAKSSEVSNKLRSLGFANSKEFKYTLGNGVVYSRSDKSVKWPYAFLCTLSIGHGVSYRIWIKNLPSVFQLLREIGASRHETYPENHVQGLINYLEGTYFENAMEALYDKLKEERKP